ncbi:DUF2147 domain-containing protein [Tenacibaculum sp. S7007]|uniref:DUF2147 domain-containing protein n=1 Tax=Tenacibaculum pelagium TaxID=2759527 RepID=A0A839AT97_9FLAO|nr:DUF2147 domain-containing protein [Tenacibaculum pelagium]MBA6157324.1 DUF2147 domain-containing protein [Tenacibaculum pelagium]
MKQLLLIIFSLTIFTSSAQNNDKIVGVWDVKTDYYQAIYEIVDYKGKFFGKIHYYNDGTSEYKGSNKKEDYFLTDIEKKGEKYINGKMYLPDGSFYKVIFTLKNDNTLEVLMTVEGQPYKEVWKRNTKYK